jgi:aryl-alcohol dehydrogenase-like predicted oxidoreductase
MRYLTVEGLPPVSKIGLGTMRFGEKTFSTDLARALVKRALELGVTHFDTAENYGFGRSERLLGEALAGEGVTVGGDSPGDVVVTSKYSPLLPQASVLESHARASRDRLAVPYISLYLLHMPNPLAPRRAVAEGFRRAVGSGVIGATGVSNHSLSQWQAAEAAYAQPIVANEVMFNILRPKALAATIPWAAANNRMIIAASPLGQGILTGRYTPDSLPSASIATHRKFAMAFSAARPTQANLRRLSPLLEQLKQVAASHDAKVATVALAWAIAHDPVVVIPGASTVEQLEANAAAADLTLGADEIAAIDAASATVRGKAGR